MKKLRLSFKCSTISYIYIDLFVIRIGNMDEKRISSFDGLMSITCNELRQLKAKK